MSFETTTFPSSLTRMCQCGLFVWHTCSFHTCEWMTVSNNSPTTWEGTLWIWLLCLPMLSNCKIYVRSDWQRGPIPFRSPVYYVVGNPIPATENANSLREELNHDTFIYLLFNLFSTFLVFISFLLFVTSLSLTISYLSISVFGHR